MLSALMMHHVGPVGTNISEERPLHSPPLLYSSHMYPILLLFSNIFSVSSQCT
jgi:hypothetical protein